MALTDGRMTGAELREWITGLGMTHERFAEAVGYGQTYISNLCALGEEVIPAKAERLFRAVMAKRKTA